MRRPSTNSTTWFSRVAPGADGLLLSGATLGVVTGKKYERYALDALGEEDIDTPAGHFRTDRKSVV